MSYSVIELMNDKGVCRTAPATPSMFKIIDSQKDKNFVYFEKLTVCIKIVQSAKNGNGQNAFYPSSVISFVTFVTLLSS